MTNVRRHFLLCLTLVVGPAACATRVQTGPTSAVGPQLSVERFLQAANTRDLDSMSRLFGTPDGPIADTGSTFGCAFKKIGSWFGGTPCLKRTDVEIRMDAIASVLRHTDYTVGRQEIVAGREHPTTRVLVDLVVTGRTVPAVPFVVVQAGVELVFGLLALADLGDDELDELGVAVGEGEVLDGGR